MLVPIVTALLIGSVTAFSADEADTIESHSYVLSPDALTIEVTLETEPRPPAPTAPSPAAPPAPPPPPRDTCPIGVPETEWPTECFELVWPLNDDESEDPAPGVSISDFVSFAPAAPGITAEPGAFAVRKLHSNFIADPTVHIRTGLLLGRPASAEFTPISYTWDYDDGSTRTTTTAGRTWQALGVPEFESTATSHAYAEKGVYEATVTTRYAVRAAYAPDGAWFSVPGTLAVTSAPHSVHVVTVKTVLVDKDCREDPRGPGC